LYVAVTGEGALLAEFSQRGLVSVEGARSTLQILPSSRLGPPDHIFEEIGP